jgi:hypothetical protein
VGRRGIGDMTSWEPRPLTVDVVLTTRLCLLILTRCRMLRFACVDRQKKCVITAQVMGSEPSYVQL